MVVGFGLDMLKRFRVEGQQLGAAQTETVVHPGECRHFGHATKLRGFKSHNTHEDPRLGGPIPVTALTRNPGAYHGSHTSVSCGGVKLIHKPR